MVDPTRPDAAMTFWLGLWEKQCDCGATDDEGWRKVISECDPCAATALLAFAKEQTAELRRNAPQPIHSVVGVDPEGLRWALRVMGVKQMEVGFQITVALSQAPTPREAEGDG